MAHAEVIEPWPRSCSVLQLCWHVSWSGRLPGWVSASSL